MQIKSEIKNWFKQGLSLTEAMAVLTIVSIAIATTMPIITKMQEKETKIDNSTIRCIKAGVSDWYDDDTGDTDIEELTSGTDCYAAIVDAQFDRNKALETAEWIAENGATSAEKIMAKKILRFACDKGGQRACDYFIRQCWKFPDVNNHCDITSTSEGFLDLPYYLHQHSTNSSNLGAAYINTRIAQLAPRMIENLVDAADYHCDNNQAPNETQNLNANYACKLSEPSVYIRGCNQGIEGACQEAFDNNWNKSCSQIKTAWPEAPSRIYKLTYDGYETPVEIKCNMKTVATAAISGCTGMRALTTTAGDYCTSSPYSGTSACSDDCQTGYDNKYNRSCSEIFKHWGTKTGSFSLTYDVANATEETDPPLEAASCDTTGTCIEQGPGTTCADGTIYFGRDTLGNNLFVTPYDQAATSWINPDPFIVGVDSDGASNTLTLLSRDPDVDIEAPYEAAELCKALNDANYLGHNDWYLPELYQLTAIFSKIRSNIASPYDNPTTPGELTLTQAYHWTSSEDQLRPTRAYIKNYSGGTNIDYKSATHNVRCVRTVLNGSHDTDCLVVGSKCADGTYYMGTYNINSQTMHQYVTEKEQGETSWNDGTQRIADIDALLAPAELSYTDGDANTTLLTTNANVLASPDGPYPPVEACTAMNAANAGSGTSFDNGTTYHNDWYLPAAAELEILMDNAGTGDLEGALDDNNYWSSSEYTPNTLRMRRGITSNGGQIDNYDKYAVANTRCIRKQAN